MMLKALAALILVGAVAWSQDASLAQPCPAPPCAARGTAGSADTAATGQVPPPVLDGQGPTPVVVVQAPPSDDNSRNDPLRPADEATTSSWIALLLGGATTLTVLHLITRARIAWPSAEVDMTHSQQRVEVVSPGSNGAVQNGRRSPAVDRIR
jgi:hypothetical protein